MGNYNVPMAFNDRICGTVNYVCREY